ncbi:hypothetical protein pipiens_016848, partial [Culex pipiens pipiens]
ITGTANDRHQHAEVTESTPNAIRRMSIQETPEDLARDHVAPVQPTPKMSTCEAGDTSS